MKQAAKWAENQARQSHQPDWQCIWARSVYGVDLNTVRRRLSVEGYLVGYVEAMWRLSGRLWCRKPGCHRFSKIDYILYTSSDSVQTEMVDYWVHRKSSQEEKISKVKCSEKIAKVEWSRCSRLFRSRKLTPFHRKICKPFRLYNVINNYKPRKIGTFRAGYRAKDTTDILISQLLKIELYDTETVACHPNRCVLCLRAGSDFLKLRFICKIAPATGERLEFGRHGRISSWPYFPFIIELVCV